MQIDRPLIEYLARLSRLQLTEEEIPVYQRQLTGIVALMEQLAAIDVSSVPETAHALEAVNVFRADEPAPSFPREKLLENAPEARGGAFAVPKVL